MSGKHLTDIVCSPQQATGSISRTLVSSGTTSQLTKSCHSLIQMPPELGTRMLSVSLSDVSPWAAQDTWVAGVSWAREKFCKCYEIVAFSNNISYFPPQLFRKSCLLFTKSKDTRLTKSRIHLCCW